MKTDGNESYNELSKSEGKGLLKSIPLILVSCLLVLGTINIPIHGIFKLIIIFILALSQPVILLYFIEKSHNHVFMPFNDGYEHCMVGFCQERRKLTNG